MKIDRVRNTKNNIIWGFFNKIIILILPFITRTILIHTLGLEYLGLSSLFASLIQVLNLAELGISSIIVFNMYKPIVDNDIAKISALLSFYRKAYRYIGLFILGVGIIVIPILPKFIKGSYPNDINIYILYGLYLFNTVISYFLYAYKICLLTAHQRNDIISNVNSVLGVGQFVIQVILLLLFRNYYLFYIAVPVCAIINNILIAIITKKMFPQYSCKGNISKEERQSITKNIKGVMLGKICVTSRNSLDNIFISSYLGLTAVAIYGNYYYIMSAIIGFLQVFCSAISAGIGNSVASESVMKNYNDMKKINFLYAWIVGICTVCLVNLYQPFMQVWVGEEKMLSGVEMILFCIYFYCLTLGDIRSQYSSAAGLWWQGRFYVVAEIIGNLILNYVLIRWFGIVGVIIATLITIVVCNFIWGSQIVFKYYFKMSSKEFFMNHIKHSIAILISVVCAWILCHYCINDNNIYVEFLLRGIISVLVPNVIFYCIYRKNIVFKEALELVKKMFR